MTRPQIIRADTIDLQDQDAPSAQDHARQHARTGALGEGSPAPHQADALRHVELELSEQHGRSPRASQDLSGKELQLLHDEDIAHDRDPNENLLRNSTLHNGGMNGDDEMEGVEGDDGLDDDMMDKISSSPSIGEDGGCSSSLPLPPHGTPFRFPSKDMSQARLSDYNSAFYIRVVREGLPRPCQFEEEGTISKGHHHYHHLDEQGLRSTQLPTAHRLGNQEQTEEPERVLTVQRGSEMRKYSEEYQGSDDSYDADFDANDFHRLLLPTNDPLLNDESLSELSTELATASSSVRQHARGDGNANEGSDDNDDDAADISFVEDSRYVDSGWGGECLRETEEIDFDFVYALHTFVATVEGQANATKGDTMVLLDDSNSYWWLVRVVKDGSIGYLPAEHIETPTERLARLNKHRNLDLSQTMLTDQEEDKRTKPLDPLKKVMRRRNVKTVQFAPPSYVEPSDNGTTTDEEEDGHDDETLHDDASVTEREQQQQESISKTSEVRPVEPAAARDQEIAGKGIDPKPDTENRNGPVDVMSQPEKSRTSDENLDRSDDSVVSRSRKGNVRNTDSFFKDENLETRKINLTPSLLRDDSSRTTNKPSDSTLKNRPSLDSLSKDAPSEKVKDEKRKKEKRGMLGGMFKRKDKKGKGQERDGEDSEKTSSDLSRHSPQPKESMESLSQDAQVKAAPQPHRQTSKLQKQPPAKLSPKSSYQSQKDTTGSKSTPLEQEVGLGSVEPNRGQSLYTEQNGSLGQVQPESQLRKVEEPLVQQGLQIRDVTPIDSSPSASPNERSRGESLSAKDAPSGFAAADNRFESETKSKPQFDDTSSSSFDNVESRPKEIPSDQEVLGSGNEGMIHKVSSADQHHMAIAQAAQYESYDSQGPQLSKARSRERLSESPVQVLHQDTRSQDATPQPRVTSHQPPPLMADTSSTEEPSTTSPISPSSSPELIDHPSDAAPAEADSSPGKREVEEDKPESPRDTLTTTTPASSAPAEHPSPSSTSTTPTWSDASLRAYLDNDDSDIRDLLLVVHDKTGVTPRTDHPVVRSLYREENKKLDTLSSNLDNLLDQYLTRKRGGKKAGGGMAVR